MEGNHEIKRKREEGEKKFSKQVSFLLCSNKVTRLHDCLIRLHRGTFREKTVRRPCACVRVRCV